MQDLISAWENFDHTKTPFVLAGDKIPEKITRRHDGWEKYIGDPEFGSGNDNKLHLDLLPIPYMGNLKTASVFLLMLNPGLGPHDYYGEYKIPEYRKALIENIQQKYSNTFLFLDPRFSWHGGYAYWHLKLHRLIEKFADKSSISYGRARKFFQTEIAVVELVPYHSISFSMSPNVIRKLKSVELVREFVKKRAETADSLVVVTRSVKTWDLPKRDNIINFNEQQARSAHLSHQSEKILIHLQERFDKAK